jgi:uncharacterized membrane protein YfcA
MKTKKRTILTIFPLIAVGAGAGLVNGLLGAGGGILIVYGLSALFKSSTVDRRSIFATAIAVILPLSALSALQYLRQGSFNVPMLAWLVLPAVAGGALGALLLRRLSVSALSRLFAAVVLTSGIILAV